MENKWPHFVFFILCNFGPLAWGPHLHLLIKAAKDVSQTPEDLRPNHEILSNIFLYSAVIVPLIYGVLMRYLSCKMLLLLTNVIHTFAFCLYFFRTLATAICASLAAGIASTGSMLVTPFYIHECVTPTYRSIMGALLSMSMTVCAPAIRLLDPPDLEIVNYAFLAYSTIFFSGFYWLPNSPVWLTMQGKNEEAESSLRKLRSEESDVKTDIKLIQEELEVTRIKDAGFVNVLRDRRLRKAIILAFGLMVVQQCTDRYSKVQISVLNILLEKDLKIYVLTLLVATVLGLCFLVCFGRKIALIIPGTTVFVIHILMIMTMITKNLSSNTFFYLNLFCVASHNIGLGVVPFVMIPELLPQAARSVSVMIGWSLALIISVFYRWGTIKLFYESPWYSYCIATSLSLLGLLFIIIFIFETKGKTTVEIYHILGKPFQIISLVEPWLAC